MQAAGNEPITIANEKTAPGKESGCAYWLTAAIGVLILKYGNLILPDL